MLTSNPPAVDVVAAQGLPPITPDLTYHPVDVGTVLHFGRSPGEDLALLRYLRDVTSHAVRLRWRLAGLPCFPLHTHVHLVAPSGGVDADSTAHATAWAADYRYGSFFYRRGPGFVAIKDVRPESEDARLTIDEGAEHFLAMAEAHTLADLEPAAQELVDTVSGAGLLLRVDQRLLVLPYRLRHWPVPYLAI
ncbi:DUF5825 family protein [Micromonospora sagamiensis]|uniref:Uncharacterized protein n=2 Tax=Micromonospora sagamiensis TaxID=47875 RepID=A0A562WG26_9ACTN|nr:DUF5825 family protein [Micromonospora sagamiensis]TWJ29128.1 hypothetical protein JD81_02634 [Micromonospora sagamiensis]BCL17848.1 hypothetical protein GCM10017556_55870 [Micromonospora sagamiensis]